MTRETKIGLLVGLAFIIVIGILLSDHVTNSAEPPAAQLANAGSNVRSSVANPGGPGAAQTPPITQAPAIQPQQPVPTQREIAPRPQVVQVEVGGPTRNPPVTVEQQQPAPVPGDSTATQTQGNPLIDAANQHGEQIVPLNDQSGQPIVSNNPPRAKEYTAQPGDTLSRMAGRLMGANTKANRDAIVKANPALAGNRDVVIAGKTYIIPTSADAVAVNTPAPTPAVTESPSRSESARTTTYVAKPGDSLWRIADEQLGNGKLYSVIRDLNKDVLKGGETVHPGMALRLPLREVASVN